MSTDKKDDMPTAEKECPLWAYTLAQANLAIEEIRMVRTATCTEEIFSWEPPVRADQAFTRVAFIPGSRTVVTGLNLDNFRYGHTPTLLDVDFTMPGPMVRQHMSKLGSYWSDTYMTVRTGVAPARM